MADIMQELLGIVSKGEVLKDPKEGNYEATVSEVTTQEFNSGALALSIKLIGLHDANGQQFDHVEKVFVPNSGASAQFKFMFLDTLKTLNLVDMSYENAITFDQPDEQFEAFGRLVAEALEGVVLPLRITRNKNTGYYNARFRRVKTPR